MTSGAVRHWQRSWCWVLLGLWLASAGLGWSQEAETPATAPEAKLPEVSDNPLSMVVESPLGVMRMRTPSPLTITIENAGAAFKGRIVVSTTSWTPTTQYFQPLELPSGTSKRLRFTAFEGDEREYEIAVIDENGNQRLNTRFQPETIFLNDAAIIQVGGHPADFAALQGATLQVRQGIADLVKDANLLKNNQTYASMQYQEPAVIPLLHFHRMAPADLPTKLTELQWVNTLLLDLGTWSQLAPEQRGLIARFVRLGGNVMFYPALDYGYPTTRLEDPLLPAPLEVGYTLANATMLNQFAQRFAGYSPSLDRPLRLLNVDFSQRPLPRYARLTTPGGDPLLISREEGMGRTTLLLFQPVQLTDLPGAPLRIAQLLDRTGLTGATENQWLDDPDAFNPISRGTSGATASRFQPWYPATPTWNFVLRNWAQRINPAVTKPFKGTQSTVRLWAVPMAFLKREGPKLIGYLLFVLLVTQVILQWRRRVPAVWALLPLTSMLFVFLVTPVTVPLETPYRFEEWNLVRFPGAGTDAIMAGAYWVANLSRHGSGEILEMTDNPDFFFDEFVYSRAFGPDIPTVQVRVDEHPAVVEIHSSRLGDPRLMLGWGPVKVPGQLTGSLTFHGTAQPATLHLVNDTPWDFLGGAIYTQSEYFSVSFEQVDPVPAGGEATVEIPTTALVYHPDLAVTRTALHPTFGFSGLAATNAQSAWVPAQLELLAKAEAMNTVLEFTRPGPEFAYVPETVMLVGQLTGFNSGIRLDGHEPEGERFTLATTRIPIVWENATRPDQPPFGWEYYANLPK